MHSLRLIMSTIVILLSVTDIARGESPPIWFCAVNDGDMFSTLPISGQPLPKLETHLTPKKSYKVVKESKDWVRVDVENLQLWSFRRNFGDASLCNKSNSAQHTQTSPSKVAPHKAVTSSSCACGHGNVCTGPRGGRYCITSGGNKVNIRQTH